MTLFQGTPVPKSPLAWLEKKGGWVRVSTTKRGQLLGCRKIRSSKVWSSCFQTAHFVAQKLPKTNIDITPLTNGGFQVRNLLESRGNTPFSRVNSLFNFGRVFFMTDPWGNGIPDSIDQYKLTNHILNPMGILVVYHCRRFACLMLGSKVAYTYIPKW